MTQIFLPKRSSTLAKLSDFRRIHLFDHFFEKNRGKFKKKQTGPLEHEKLHRTITVSFEFKGVQWITITGKKGGRADPSLISLL